MVPDGPIEARSVTAGFVRVIEGVQTWEGVVVHSILLYNSERSPKWFHIELRNVIRERK